MNTVQSVTSFSLQTCGLNSESLIYSLNKKLQQKNVDYQEFITELENLFKELGQVFNETIYHECLNLLFKVTYDQKLMENTRDPIQKSLKEFCEKFSIESKNLDYKILYKTHIILKLYGVDYVISKYKKLTSITFRIKDVFKEHFIPH